MEKAEVCSLGVRGVRGEGPDPSRDIADALTFLRSVYQNSKLELHWRMKAAIAALPFESPKLAVTAVVHDQDFAALLDQRLRRIQEMKVIEASKVEHPASELDGPPSISDRRFRRRF